MSRVAVAHPPSSPLLTIESTELLRLLENSGLYLLATFSGFSGLKSSGTNAPTPSFTIVLLISSSSK
ncbi:hypothetical protein K439DRAFT_749265 [Ramaria rubella]|nr:hypothetical protein K439DRAFT_749265 [Ramaria rubella]